MYVYKHTTSLYMYVYKHTTPFYMCITCIYIYIYIHIYIYIYIYINIQLLTRIPDRGPAQQQPSAAVTDFGATATRPLIPPNFIHEQVEVAICLFCFISMTPNQ